jgi:hypothetical protein
VFPFSEPAGRGASRYEADNTSLPLRVFERHVRFLAPLAYLSPKIIEAIGGGR